MRSAEDARTRRTDAAIGRAATLSANENAPAQRQQKVGAIVHGGFWLWRILRSGAPNRRSAVGRRFEERRHGHAVAKGFPSWSACPLPDQVEIDNLIRQEFLTAAEFAGFWKGGPDAVAPHYRRDAALLGRLIERSRAAPQMPDGGPRLDEIKGRYKASEKPT